MLHTLVFPIPFRMESQTLDKKRATSTITNMADNLSMRSRILELSYRVCFSRDLSLGLTVCKALGFGILQSASIVNLLAKVSATVVYVLDAAVVTYAVLLTAIIPTLYC